MDGNALRAMQAPIKERCRNMPEAAVVTLKARGTLDEAGIACKVETGQALKVAGLHPATGGSGLELCSGDMLLEALVACAGVTLKAVATALDIPLARGAIAAEGDLEFRGTLGVARDAPVGFACIQLSFQVETDAPQDKLDQLLELTERYCVVYRFRAAVLQPEPIGLAGGEAALDAQRQTAHVGGAIPLNGAPGKEEDAGQRAKTVGHPATTASRPSAATHPGPGTEPGAERLRNHTQSRVSGLGAVVHQTIRNGPPVEVVMTRG